MSIISAGTTTTTALSSTGNTDGTLQLQVNGTTPSVTLNTLGAIGVGSTPSFGTAGQALLSNGSTSAAYWGSVSAAAATPTSIGTVYGKTDTGSITFVGYQAGNASSSAAHNVAVGASAMAAITTGTRNIVLGSYAAAALTTGEGNIVLGTFGVGSGTNTFSANTSGSSNIAIGGIALNSNTTASYNIAIGEKALSANTTGTPNLAIGLSSLQANTTGANNVAIGDNTLRSSTTAGNNTAVGYQSLYADTTGTNNSALGSGSLKGVTTGYGNVGVGLNAASALTTGGENVVIGYPQGFGGWGLTTGSNNVFVGARAGEVVTTGNRNICIGYYANPSANNGTEQLVIGVYYGSTGKGNSTGFIDPNGGGVYQGNNSSSWSTTSDQRLKKNIVDNSVGLTAINSIRVRNFEYRVEDEITELPTHCAIKKEGVQLGVIAQELQAVLPECVKQESTGVLSVDPDNLTWYLVNAVKELTARIAVLEGK